MSNDDYAESIARTVNSVLAQENQNLRREVGALKVSVDEKDKTIRGLRAELEKIMRGLTQREKDGIAKEFVGLARKEATLEERNRINNALSAFISDNYDTCGYC